MLSTQAQAKMCNSAKCIVQFKLSNSAHTPHYENVPFEVPQGWCWCRLQDIAFFGGGKTPSMDVKEYWNNGQHLWVTSKDMKSEIITDSIMKISDIALETMTVYPSGTILMVTRSGILRHTLPISILGKEGTVNQDLKTISLIGNCNPQYIQKTVKACEQLILEEYHKDGTTVDSIDFDKFKLLPILLPPLAEQNRIVAEIKKWFALVDIIEQGKDDLQATIAQAKSKILDLAIHGKLIPQDPNDEPAIKLLKRVNPSFTPCDNGQYGNIPTGWCMAQLGDLFDHNTGKALNKSVIDNNGEYLSYLTTSNVYWDRFELTDIRSMFFKNAEIEKCTVKLGDLLVCEGGDIGRAAIWNEDYSICIQNHLHRLRAKDTSISHRLYMYVLMNYKNNHLIQGNGIGLMGLSAKALHKIVVPMPPIREQKRIVKAVDEWFAKLSYIQLSIETQ